MSKDEGILDGLGAYPGNTWRLFYILCHLGLLFLQPTVCLIPLHTEPPRNHCWVRLTG
ncbi:hypothetical protein Hanom_Chr10g00886381 [Helianthus anomalus]